MMSDTISDMLTQIRNGLMAKKAEVVLPYSTFKHNLAKVLQIEGWLRAVEMKEFEGPASTRRQGEAGKKSLRLILKYGSDGQPVISGIKRISKPGQRIYSSRAEIPSVLGGMGTTII